MTEKMRNFVIVLGFCTLSLATAMGASSDTSQPKASSGAATDEIVKDEVVKDEVVKDEVVTSESRGSEVIAVEEDTGANFWTTYPNVCETFTVLESDKRVRNKRGKLVYPSRYKRNRYRRLKSHQKKTRELIRMVAREMGADVDARYILDMIARHESGWNPEAIHVLNGDRQANINAWEKYSYDRRREMQIEARMREVSAKTKEFWRYKSRLRDLRLYKGNEYWNTQIEYVRKIPERTLRGETTPAFELTETRSTWSYGYGLFGMNAVLYVHVFDRRAPPWALCGDEGIVATITAVWALRDQQAACQSLSSRDSDRWGEDGGNARGVIQRFARGHCGDKKLGPVWQRLMSDYSKHVAWDEVPSFGNKFPPYEMRRVNGRWVPRYEVQEDPVTGDALRDDKGRVVYKLDELGNKVKIPTDRKAMIEHMIEKARAEGLLREEPLARKDPEMSPVILDDKRAPTESSAVVPGSSATF